MIRINGFEVFVPADQSISYQLINPHLLYDSIPSSQANIPVFPAVRTNRAIFDYWEEPQAGAYLPEMHYEHFHNGELIREGFFILTEASLESGYAGAFTDRLGLFFGDYQNLSLQEIDFGTLVLPSPLTPVLPDPDSQQACCFPTIVNPNFYGTNGDVISYSGKINDFVDGEYMTGPIVPQFFANWILQRIAEITGTKITGDFLSHPVWSQLLLVNLREVEDTITVKNHLPNFSIVQFILELRKIANLKFTFNAVAKSLDIGFWEDHLQAPTEITWSDKATVGEKKTPENNTRIQLSMAVDSSDALAKDKPTVFADYISPEVAGAGNGIAKIEFKFSTLLTDPEAGLPACNQEGQTSRFAQDAKPWSPRLLFWHGMGENYPIALSEMEDVALSPSQIAATSWRHTIALRERQFYLAKDFILNEADIAKLDFSKKYHVDGVDYLIAQLNIGIPIKGVATALLVGGI